MAQVFHKLATSNDDASKYGFDSWIDYWKNQTNRLPGFTCPFCGKFPTRLDGAHVINTRDWETYIVPCCKDRNSKYTQKTLDLKKEKVFFEIEDRLLVLHPAS